MYGKLLTDGALKEAPLDYILEDGSVIFDFRNKQDLLNQYGFKEVKRTIPEYDEKTQYVIISGYTETADYIATEYTVIDKYVDEETRIKNATLAVAKWVAQNHLSDAECLDVKDLFPDWAVGVQYITGYKVIYNEVLYKVLQGHTSTAEWSPDVAPSLFAEVLNETINGEIPEWKQPDSTNAYMTGDKVILDGVIYESLIDNNVWKPTEYLAGWKVVTK